VCQGSSQAENPMKSKRFSEEPVIMPPTTCDATAVAGAARSCRRILRYSEPGRRPRQSGVRSQTAQAVAPRRTMVLCSGGVRRSCKSKAIGACHRLFSQDATHGTVGGSWGRGRYATAGFGTRRKSVDITREWPYATVCFEAGVHLPVNDHALASRIGSITHVFRVNPAGNRPSDRHLRP
jgi:hypothetical protein